MTGGFVPKTQKFAFPEPRLGLTNICGVCQNLARIVGLGKAMEMSCSGVTIDAQEAYQVGLVYKVVPLENLMAEAMKLANEFKFCYSTPNTY